MKATNYKKSNIAYQTKVISKLMEEGNYNLAWKIIQELLPEYKDDERLKFQIAIFKVSEKNFEEALSLIEELNEERNFISKTELYVILNLEEKEFKMYQKYFKYFKFDDPFYIHDRRYRLLYIYLNKKFNPTFELPKFLGVNYLEQQIYSYNKEKTLENVKFNHLDPSNMDKGIFSPNINIEELYNYANNTIKNNNVIGPIKKGVQVFRFLYPNCGLVRSKESANGFSVIASLGTKNIIAIYPSKLKYLQDVIEYSPIKRETKKLAKVKNGIDRFNERYNKTI